MEALVIRLSTGIRFSATLIDIGKFYTMLLERDDNLFDAAFDSFVYACSAGLPRDIFEGGFSLRRSSGGA